MKLQNIFRTHVIVIGFAGALLLASSAPAQEIVNTSWDDGPGVVPLGQVAPTAAVDDFTSTAVDSGTIRPLAQTAKPAITQEAVVSQQPPLPDWITTSLLVCIALAALYALAETRRRDRKRRLES